MKPLLRWTGSKRSILPLLLSNVPDCARYVEPFAGSACLFFAKNPSTSVLSDSNARLMATYAAVAASPDEVFAALEGLPPPEHGYYDVRDADRHLSSEVDRAASFLYLNRCCYNGVYRTNRDGHFNVPRGSRVAAPHDKVRLRAAARRLQHAQLVNADFRQTLETVQRGDFVYLDPPFSRATRPHYGLYGYDSFGTNDVPALALALDVIDRRGASFLLSFGGPTAEAVAANWNWVAVKIRRQVASNAAARVNATELLISNRALVSLAVA